MNQSKIDRINELYHKSKGVGLTEEEKLEQAALRREYIDSIKNAISAQLNNMDIENEDGSITPVSERKKNHE